MKINPDAGVPVPEGDPENRDFLEVVRAAAATVELLKNHGLDTAFDDPEECQSTADYLAQSYAADPEETSKAATPGNIAKLPPQSLIMTRNILDEFGQQVVTRSVEVRHLVTNKLILESENPDARIRMRALELLGKISDVGLFTERTEVTITHQSTDELKNALREKLQRLKNPTAPETTRMEDEDIEDGVLIEGEIIDVEAEFGVETPENDDGDAE